MRALKLPVIGLGLMLSGCSTPTAAINPQAACESWQTIWPSRRDVLTDGTAEQVAGNNAARKAWCGTDSTPQRVASNTR